jgi:hypothetical protein
LLNNTEIEDSRKNSNLLPKVVEENNNKKNTFTFNNMKLVNNDNKKISKKIKFIHINKTGGTTINRYFHKKYDFYKGQIHSPSYKMCLSLVNNKDFLIFTFVRNPIDRFISSY